MSGVRIVGGTRIAFLQAFAAVKSGAQIAPLSLCPTRAERVAAALLRHVTPDFAATTSVARFLSGGLRGRMRRHVMHSIRDRDIVSGHLAVTRDGSTLLFSGETVYEREFQVGLFAVSIAKGTLRRIGTAGCGPLEFVEPHQVCVAASDGFVFVADAGNGRVQMLTPSFEFAGFYGDSLAFPTGVCADAEIVAIAEYCTIRIYNRADRALKQCIETGVETVVTTTLWFLRSHCAVIVSNPDICLRVSIDAATDAPVRHDMLHDGIFSEDPLLALACSAFDELIVCTLKPDHYHVIEFAIRVHDANTMAVLQPPLTLDPGSYFPIVSFALHGTKIYALHWTQHGFFISVIE